MEGKLKPINVIIGHLDNGLYIQKYQSDYAETNVNSYAYIKNKPNLDLKQDVITDLATIRAGAALGATALQSHQDISGKQDKLTAGDNITITGNVISATGGGGSVDAYTKAETDTLLNAKADTSTTYTKIEVDGIKSELNGDIANRLPKNLGAAESGKYLTVAENGNIITVAKRFVCTEMDDIAIADACYFLGEQTTVSVTLPDDASAGQEISVCWYNDENPATLEVQGEMLDYDYTPSANTRSEINALYDGVYWCVLGNEQSLLSEE